MGTMSGHLSPLPPHGSWGQHKLLKLTVSEGLELLLQCDGSVVGPEHFGSQAIHQILEVFVQDDCLEEGEEDKVKQKGRDAAEARTINHFSDHHILPKQTQ